MKKFPNKINKVKIDINPLHGYAFLDRWEENIWFEQNSYPRYRLITPVELKQILKKMPISSVLNFNHKLIYNDIISNLIYSSNPFFKITKKRFI